MIEKRYQIHIAACFNDVAAERLKIENVLLNLGVFPWGFSEKRTSLNTARARKQIDDCDYIVFVVSNCYGDLSASGISYLHLDFIYALNKGKTILSFVDGQSHLKVSEGLTDSAVDVSAKLDSFKQLLKRESAYYYTYNHANLLELERQVKLNFSDAIREKPALGWIRPQQNLDVTTATSSLSPSTFLPQTSTSSIEIDRLQAKIQFLEKQLARAKVVNLEPEPEPEFVSADAQQQDTIQINYRTHAYQDGNFKDLHPTRSLSWSQVLRVLAPHFHRPALENVFMRALNEYLEQTGLEVAREFLPRAHAVDRTHIDPRSLQQIKLQMKWNNWIVPQPNVTGSNRIYWALTPEGQRHLSGSTMS